MSSVLFCTSQSQTSSTCIPIGQNSYERVRCSVSRFLPLAAALFSLQLLLPAVTGGLEALRGSHSRRSSACRFANHMIAAFVSTFANTTFFAIIITVR